MKLHQLPTVRKAPDVRDVGIVVGTPVVTAPYLNDYPRQQSTLLRNDRTIYDWRVANVVDSDCREIG
jgi:hypothetical protein